MLEEIIFPGTPGYKTFELILKSLKLDQNAKDFLYPVDVVGL